jgi:deazaflavin-dependent oxidoreductase (nitroreductase family)
MAKWRNTTRIHTALYRATGGVIGARLAGIPMLLLTTRGRRTGRARTLPLAYLPDGEDFVVVASNGGLDTDPLWWRNLQTDPACEVQVRRQVHRARAERASGAERDRLWPLLVQANPQWGRYEQATRRPIPVVVLKRTA